MSKLLQIYEWTNFPPILGLSKFVKHLKQIREEFFKNTLPIGAVQKLRGQDEVGR